MTDYWEENGIGKPKSIVVCAACRSPKGVIICSARHWDLLMLTQFDRLLLIGEKKSTAGWTQGFINQFGEFMDRTEAMIVAKESGQKIDFERNGDDDVLYSEGLY